MTVQHVMTLMDETYCIGGCWCKACHELAFEVERIWEVLSWAGIWGGTYLGSDLVMNCPGWAARLLQAMLYGVLCKINISDSADHISMACWIVHIRLSTKYLPQVHATILCACVALYYLISFCSSWSMMLLEHVYFILWHRELFLNTCQMPTKFWQTKVVEGPFHFVKDKIGAENNASCIW
jgi:hypothetical protein